MIEINNLTDFSLDEEFLKKTAEKVLKEENVEDFRLSVAFIENEEMRKINKQYLKKDYPTDVLSFLEESDFGEIVICPQEVKKNTEKIDGVFKKELCRVLIHGVLHLLGYDHEKSVKDANMMDKKEKQYLKNIFN